MTDSSQPFGDLFNTQVGDTVELPDMGSGTVVERIHKKDLKPLYDTNHEHQYVRDADDETADYYAEMCSVKNCNLGRLVSKA